MDKRNERTFVLNTRDTGGIPRAILCAIALAIFLTPVLAQAEKCPVYVHADTADEEAVFTSVWITDCNQDSNAIRNAFQNHVEAEFDLSPGFNVSVKMGLRFTAERDHRAARDGAVGAFKRRGYTVHKTPWTY